MRSNVVDEMLECVSETTRLHVIPACQQTSPNGDLGNRIHGSTSIQRFRGWHVHHGHAPLNKWHLENDRTRSSLRRARLCVGNCRFELCLPDQRCTLDSFFLGHHLRSTQGRMVHPSRDQHARHSTRSSIHHPMHGMRPNESHALRIASTNGRRENDRRVSTKDYWHA